MPASVGFRPTRRAVLAGVPAALSAATPATQNVQTHPNMVVVISDQFRADCLGVLGRNPLNLTPNLDRMARHGVVFRSAYCNQPVCAPARASMFSGQYPSRHGVWRNGALPAEGSLTMASSFRQAGYSANYIGKWHLAGEPRAAVPPERRGGFLDLWEASNALEFTSHAYEGDLFDRDGKPVHFSGQYRADFLTERAQRFLRTAQQPFLLVVSYLEVHHQNDADTFDPPREYKNRYPNPFIPPDLHNLPGSWPSQLPDYFACVAGMDDCIGKLRATLAETGLDRNTIFAFLSDHGCHFKTRNTEYKRSPHDGSIHIPLVMEGPGFNRGLDIPELVSQVDLLPTLLTAAGLPVPSGVQGRNFLPLLDRRTADWRNEVYFEMSEFVTGRGLRTPQYTYAAMAPKEPSWHAVPRAPRYLEFVLYDLYRDPSQQVNLAGRAEYAKVAEELRGRLAARMAEASGEIVPIEPCWLPYP